MQRYELVEGNSSKFWEVELTGQDVTVRFGRIGTQGQEKTKSFADAAAAQREWEKLVKEKTGKGYGLVAGEGTPAPVATAAPAAVLRPAAVAAPLPPVAAPATPEAAPQPPAFDPPFAMNDAWRARLPVVRGFHVPPRDPAIVALRDQRLAAATEETLAKCPEVLATRFTHRILALLSPLRHAIAAADEEEYGQALAVAQRVRAQHEGLRVACAYLFPHLTEWGDDCVASGAEDESGLLWSCALGADVFLAHMESADSYWPDRVLPGLALQACVHGAGAVPSFAWRFARDPYSLEEEAKLVVQIGAPALLPVLVQQMQRKDVRPALDTLAERHPAAALASVIPRALEPREAMARGWAIRLALRRPEAVDAALAAIDAVQAERFRALLAERVREEAPLDRLPSLLVAPPWTRKQRQHDLPVLAIAPLPADDRLDWSPVELAAAASAATRGYGACHSPDDLCRWMSVTPEGAQRVLAGRPLQAGDIDTSRAYGPPVELVFSLPEPVRLVFWNSFPGSGWSVWDGTLPAIRKLFAQYGVAALPGYLNLLQVAPETLAAAQGIDCGGLVAPMLRAFRHLKTVRATAQAWIAAHHSTVLRQALPVAFGNGPAEARDDARHAIRWLARTAGAQVVRTAAAVYGAEMQDAADLLLAQDPLLALPARLPKLPTFFVPAAFARPELPDGRALPVAAIEHIGTMLALSRLDAPYAGLAIVKEACTRASLAEFAWDLFEAWQAAGAPPKEGWAFTALGLLGDDETARRLVPRIRAWPGESLHQRAVAGLDLLAAIGSDVALMHLNGIAGKIKFKPLQERAREKITAVAEARGFTPEELADRLVPDLGLGDDGGAELDFGARKFLVAFDEMLRPFVRDAEGVRLKDLPKPLKSDDAALAEAATTRFKQMKKDAKAIASLQLLRLELGMVMRRRWSGADFQLFFLQHPLMRHLAARLVWGVYVDGRLASCFRVAEDWTLADAQDTQFELPEDASVGIAHVLEMSPALQEGFGQLFADYEVLQPFRQLGRETCALQAGEVEQSSLTRFAGKSVATVAMLGLAERGWHRGPTLDSGWVGWFTRRLGDTLQVDAELDPGLIVGDPAFHPKQSIKALTLRRPGSAGGEGLVPFTQLDPILASEVLRDLDLLPATKD